MTPSTITAKIMAGVGYIVAFVAVLHPGYTQPHWVTGVVAALGLIIGGSVQLYDLISHHVATLAVKLGNNTTKLALPGWLTATWLNQVIQTGATAVVGIAALLHPGFTEPLAVKATISSLAGVLIVLIPFINQIFKTKVAAIQ